MGSEQYPKEFEQYAHVLPFTKYGVSSIDEFQKAQQELNNLEELRRIGLTEDEIKLYQENEAGKIGHGKAESEAFNSRLEAVYKKINDFAKSNDNLKSEEAGSSGIDEIIAEQLLKKPPKTYPEGHPMNNLHNLEQDLFGHLKCDDMVTVTKRRKLLRRLERKQDRILSQGQTAAPPPPVASSSKSEETPKPGSLWDVKELLERPRKSPRREDTIGPKKQTMYTVKENKIVRLEPVAAAAEEVAADEYRAVEIVVPVNEAEERLLEGTKMSIDDIKKMERFKDYDAGTPSKVLYLKNIASTVSREQVSLLFNQFIKSNGGPIDVRLMAGRMRGQAFVAFNYENVAISALEEVNGTILSGRPVIAQFGRNSNRLQEDLE